MKRIHIKTFVGSLGCRVRNSARVPIAPSAHQYVRHMLTVAHEGTLGEIISRFVAVPMDILGDRKTMMKEVNPDHHIHFMTGSVSMESDRIQSRQSFVPGLMNG